MCYQYACPFDKSFLTASRKSSLSIGTPLPNMYLALTLLLVVIDSYGTIALTFNGHHSFLCLPWSVIVLGSKHLCEYGRTWCKTHCVDLTTNLKHCGTCKVKCNAGETCVEGTCQYLPCDPACSTGQICINGVCQYSTCTASSSCGDPVSCGGATSCFCFTSLAGVTGCYDAGDESCFDCASDADRTVAAGGICSLLTCRPSGACVYPSGQCGTPFTKRNFFR